MITPSYPCPSIIYHESIDENAANDVLNKQLQVKR